MQNKIESNRSRNPPCPGNSFPESLIFACLFNIDWNKSPTVAIGTITAPIINHLTGDKPKPK